MPAPASAVIWNIGLLSSSGSRNSRRVRHQEAPAAGGPHVAPPRPREGLPTSSRSSRRPGSRCSCPVSWIARLGPPGRQVGLCRGLRRPDPVARGPPHGTPRQVRPVRACRFGGPGVWGRLGPVSRRRGPVAVSARCPIPLPCPSPVRRRGRPRRSGSTPPGPPRLPARRSGHLHGVGVVEHLLDHRLDLVFVDELVSELEDRVVLGRHVADVRHVVLVAEPLGYLSAPPKVRRPRTLMRYASRPGWRWAARSPDTSSPSGPSRLSRSPTCRRRPYGDWP